MRIFLIGLMLLSLTSCGLMDKNTPKEAIGTGSLEATGTTVEKIIPTVVADGTYVTLNYTLRDGSADGKILETTLYSVAEANGMTGKTQDQYTPFSVMVGSNQLIPGFENGLIGLKKGDKKTIEVPPELGYGVTPVESTIPKYQIAPKFTITQDKSVFADKITETVPRDQLPEDMKNAIVGQVFTGANNASAVVTAVSASGITLNIDNTNNPFYGKKIVVGATAETPNQETSFKITEIKGTGVTLEIVNKNSPFYNKEFATGSYVESPNGKIEIKGIQGDNVVIAQYHPMLGKTLFFDIEVLDIQ